MGAASIFNGAFVKLLKNRLKFINDKEVRVDETDDPNVTAKTMAQGSLYHRSGTDDWFVKRAGGSGTDFSKIHKGFDSGRFNIYPRGDAESALTSDFTDSANMTTSLTTTAANVARGTKAFQFAASATGATAESDSFSVPNGYKAAGRIFFSFWLKNGGQTIVRLKDKTNTTNLISETIADNSATWTFYQFSATFPSNTASLSWEVESTGAHTHYVDDVYVGFEGAMQSINSANLNDWETFTPSFSSITLGDGTVEGFKRRVGDSIEVFAEITFGSTTAVTGTIGLTIPNSLSIDTAKMLTSTPNDDHSLGVVTYHDQSFGWYHGVVKYDSSTGVLFVVYNDNGTYEISTNTSSTIPFTWTTLDRVIAKFSVPIANWTATHDLLVSDSDNVAPSRATGSDSTAIATATTTFLGFSTTDKDDDGNFTNVGSANNTTYTSTTYWTCPKSGWYLVQGQIVTSDTDLDSDENVTVYLRKNGSTNLIEQLRDVYGTLTAPRFTFKIDGVFFIAKGDNVSMALNHAAGADVTLDTSSDRSYFSIIRIDKNPALGIGNETCTIEDRKSSASAGGNSSATTVTTRTLNTLEGDQNFVSLGSNQFTLQPGKYEIEASAPGFEVDTHQIFLYDVTNTTYIKDGTSEYASAVDNVQNRSHLHHVWSITTATAYEIRHYTESAATDGLGNDADTNAANPQSNEVYTKVKVRKLK